MSRELEKNRYRVDVPTLLTGGNRIRRYFSDLHSAELFVAEKNLERIKTGSVQFDCLPVQGAQSGVEVRVVVDLYLAAKVGEVCRENLKAIKNHLGKLSAAFGGSKMDDLDPLRCRTWLRALPLAQRTRHGVFSSCRTFFRWALRYGYADKNPFDRMEAIPKGEAPRAILTPEQMDALLESPMLPYVRSWLILGGFCGLRPIEVTRSTWDAANFETGEFHVTPAAIKRDNFRSRGMRERYVKMPDSAMRLLPRDQSGQIVPVSKTTFQTHVAKLASTLGLQAWPHDCLRHSAASYMLAVKEDAGVVATWLGHTTAKMVWENYARAVPREQAEKWWRIGLCPTRITGNKKK